MDHYMYILLLKHLTNHMHFITNGLKRFLSDPKQRVPLRVITLVIAIILYQHFKTCQGQTVKST